ncbi:MAG: hypothetical protein ABEJ61_10255 [Haloferacaceae archaeon]
MTDDRQATFGADGELETDRPPEAAGTNDFGEEKAADETDGGYNRYAVSSLLQKAVRRSDEEVAAWAAWELARSGFGWHLWERLNTFVVEDLAAGPVATQVARYAELAEEWDRDSHRGKLCAVQAALAAARARSTREASNAVNCFDAVATERAEARERGADGPSFPVEPDDLDVGGRYDVALDGHTGAGSRAGRGSAFFRVHGARVGPAGETNLGARLKRRRMALDDETYPEGAIEHALTPVPADDRWDDPADAFDGRADEDEE